VCVCEMRRAGQDRTHHLLTHAVTSLKHTHTHTHTHTSLNYSSYVKERATDAYIQHEITFTVIILK